MGGMHYKVVGECEARLTPQAGNELPTGFPGERSEPLKIPELGKLKRAGEETRREGLQFFKKYFGTFAWKNSKIPSGSIWKF